jgi:hypothetical protein
VNTGYFASTSTGESIEVVNPRVASIARDYFDPTFANSWRSSYQGGNASTLLGERGLAETPHATSGIKIVLASTYSAFLSISVASSAQTNLFTKLDQLLSELEAGRQVHVSDAVLEAARRVLSSKRQDPLSEEEIASWANRLARSVADLAD